MNATSSESSTAPFAIVGDLASLPPADRERLFERGRNADVDVERAVREIIAGVRARGDAALRDLARRFDGVDLIDLEVDRAACSLALHSLDADVRSALELAAANISAFHRAQLPAPFEMETTAGVLLGRRADPLRRVGVYVPGGRAAYASSVLMGVIPAKVAGVEEVVVCSPPGPDGRPGDVVLAACALAGADRVFALGGAGAIAALAFGTESVPRVDRIVGPGNAYVTGAKQQLTGVVAIDSPAGPSEVLVIADETADAMLVAAELLAQAEHDPDAAAVLVSTDRALLDAVQAAVRTLLETQPRADIIRAAFAARGALLHASTLGGATAFAEAYAPEHLLVMTRDPRALLPQIRAAGTIFLGAASSVAFGDYLTGANHVLPTAGLSRAYSGLSTGDFLRWTTYQELTTAGAATLATPTVTLAAAEGLPAHALAARLRSAGVSANVAASDHASRSRASVTPTEVPLRAAYAAISLYDPQRLPCDLDLSDNTSLFGPAPSVRAAIANAADARITRYPAVYADDLRRALAELHGVAPENVATGSGSDDVIDSALRAFCDPGDTVAYPDPTFGMVPVFSRMNALHPVPVPLAAGFALDADALIRERARVTYICRPNNPTGTQFERAAVLRVCREASGIVLIDEAYADFAGEDLVKDVAASDRVLVLRTLSKAYGLAGLRVGYAIGPERLIAEVEKSRGPYKVSGLAETAALAVLARDSAWVAACTEQVRTLRARLLAELRARGIDAFDSAANFVLLRVPGRAREWNAALRARGVAVRPFEALGTAGECIRVSVGPWPMMQQFLDALDDVLEHDGGER